MHIHFRGIVTKYLSATNFRCSRIKATTGDHHYIEGYDSIQHELINLGQSASNDDVHRFAAQQLANKMQWGEITSGCALPSCCNGFDYAFCTK